MKEDKALNVFMYVVMAIAIIWVLTLVLIGIYMDAKEKSCYNLSPSEFYNTDFCKEYRNE